MENVVYAFFAFVALLTIYKIITSGNTEKKSTVTDDTASQSVNNQMDIQNRMNQQRVFDQSVIDQQSVQNQIQAQITIQ